MIESDRAERKRLIIEYFKDVPIQRRAAQYVGITEDTFTDWKRSDSDFSDALHRAESECLRRIVKGLKKEFQGERLFPELREHKNIEHSGEIAIPILGGIVVPNNLSNEQTPPTQE